MVRKKIEGGTGKSIRLDLGAGHGYRKGQHIELSGKAGIVTRIKGEIVWALPQPQATAHLSIWARICAAFNA